MPAEFRRLFRRVGSIRVDPQLQPLPDRIADAANHLQVFGPCSAPGFGLQRAEAPSSTYQAGRTRRPLSYDWIPMQAADLDVRVRIYAAEQRGPPAVRLPCRRCPSGPARFQTLTASRADSPDERPTEFLRIAADQPLAEACCSICRALSFGRKIDVCVRPNR